MKKIGKIAFALTLSLSLFACKKKTYKDVSTTKAGGKITNPTKTNGSTTSSSGTNSKNQYKKEGNYIYFGTYPQTLETKDSIITEIEGNITAFRGPAYATADGWITTMLIVERV